MENIEIKFQIKTYTDLNELVNADQNLINEAIKASSSAYAPYSEFSVGAAVLLDNGEIVRGSNQENAAYPSGLCAERVALFYANAQFPDQKVKSIAICAKNKHGFIQEPVPPCGACRQVITESSDRFKNNIRILLYGQKYTAVIEDAKQLLPLFFIGDNLK